MVVRLLGGSVGMVVGWPMVCGGYLRRSPGRGDRVVMRSWESALVLLYDRWYCILVEGL